MQIVSKETIQTKCQIWFSEKNIINLSSAELTLSLISVKSKSHQVSITLLSPSLFSSTTNFGSKPAIVGRKNGAALGAFGGSLGLFLCCKVRKYNHYMTWVH